MDGVHDIYGFDLFGVEAQDWTYKAPQDILALYDDMEDEVIRQAVFYRAAHALKPGYKFGNINWVRHVNLPSEVASLGLEKL